MYTKQMNEQYDYGNQNIAHSINMSSIQISRNFGQGSNPIKD